MRGVIALAGKAVLEAWAARRISKFKCKWKNFKRSPICFFDLLAAGQSLIATPVFAQENEFRHVLRTAGRPGVLADLGAKPKGMPNLILFEFIETEGELAER